MGKTAYKKCKEIIDSLKRDGYLYEVPEPELKLAIMKQGGADPRTIMKYHSLMIYTGLIHSCRETERGVIFRIGTKPIQRKLVGVEE